MSELHVAVSIPLNSLPGCPLACGDPIVVAYVPIGPLSIPSSGDLDAPYSAIGQVYRARESVCVTIVAPAHIKRAHDRVVAARVVVSVYTPEIDIAEAVLLTHPLPDSVLARASRVVRGTAAIPAVQWLAHGIGNEPCPAPHQVEGVALGATIGILNPYDRRAAAAAWVLNQLLSSAAINAAESKLTRIRRYRPRTLKPPPLGRLSGQRSQEAAVAADFNLRGAVHVNLDGALARIVTAASGEVCPALPGLGAYWHDQDRSDRQNQEAAF